MFSSRYSTLLPALLGVLLLLLTALTACGTTNSGSSGTIEVVAAENFWGSIASQVGGSHVHVTSIIDNPDVDPHDYEPKTSIDSR